MNMEPIKAMFNNRQSYIFLIAMIVLLVISFFQHRNDVKYNNYTLYLVVTYVILISSLLVYAKVVEYVSYHNQILSWLMVLLPLTYHVIYFMAKGETHFHNAVFTVYEGYFKCTKVVQMSPACNEENKL